MKSFLLRMNVLGVTLAFATICSYSPSNAAETQLPRHLWEDMTDRMLPATSEWTNRVEVADLNADGRVDLLFANGGNYSEPGAPELNRVFLNRGSQRPFEEATERVLGSRPDYARVIKVRDVSGDGVPDILVGTTFQTQSRLYLGKGGGAYQEVTESHFPQRPASVGDLEVGDVDGDGDLDVVLADWGPGNNMTNVGGRTLLWVNDGRGHFTDVTSSQMPETLVRFSWDLEFIDFDNDFDLDIVVSSKRGGGGSLFVNDGSGHFAEQLGALPQYTNNYDFEPMDLDGDGFLDLVTVNDGEIVGGMEDSRREHVFRNDRGKKFVDTTYLYWPDGENIGEDDNNIIFLDYDSDGDADFIISSLSGNDRLLVNDGAGHLKLAQDVFTGPPTPGTLSLVLADLNGDHRLDVVQGQGEHPTASEERVFLGRGLAPDTASPVIAVVDDTITGGPTQIVRIRARVHDNKSPTMPHDWRSVTVQWTKGEDRNEVPMRWYGEHLWTARIPLEGREDLVYRICAVDAAGNTARSEKEAIAGSSLPSQVATNRLVGNTGPR